MAAPRTFNEAQRAAIAELVNDRGLSVQAATQTLAAGYEELPPFKINRDSVDRIAKQARAEGAKEIEELELAEALDTLGRKSLAIIGHRLACIEAKTSSFDAQEVLTIMRALTEAKGLVKPKRASKEGEEPTGLLGTLRDTNAGTEPNQTHTTHGSVPSHAARAA